MNSQEIVQQLIAERDKLNIAIAALQGLEAPRRRGRPAKNPPAAPARKRRRPKRSKAQREAQAERMRKYWEERKKQQKRGTDRSVPSR